MSVQVRIRSALVAIPIFAVGVRAQTGSDPQPQTAPPITSAPDSGAPDATPNLEDPAVRDQVAANKHRVELEKQLKKIRFRHFGSMARTDIRQAGIAKLKSFTDPIIFPALLELFADEQPDVRLAVFDHLRDLRTDEADATLTWAAVFDKNPSMRLAARQRLADRVHESGGSERVSDRVKTILAAGLAHVEPGEFRDDPAQRVRNEPAVAAAEIVGQFDLVQLVPNLIRAQVQVAQQTTAGVGGQGGGDRANIVIGTQRAFVADLNPVVGESAVAFDPVIGVITEGTVLRVVDAFVVVYRTEIHYQLVNMTSRRMGVSTEHLGYEPAKWREWYAYEWVPRLQVEKREREAAAQANTAR